MVNAAAVITIILGVGVDELINEREGCLGSGFVVVVVAVAAAVVVVAAIAESKCSAKEINCISKRRHAFDLISGIRISCSESGTVGGGIVVVAIAIAIAIAIAVDVWIRGIQIRKRNGGDI